MQYSTTAPDATSLECRYELEPTQELLAIGYANIAGALFNSYTTTGSFSRSAVNNSCGAKTPLATIISGFTVMIVLLCLTTVFTNMSNNAQVRCQSRRCLLLLTFAVDCVNHAFGVDRLLVGSAVLARSGSLRRSKSKCWKEQDTERNAPHIH